MAKKTAQLIDGKIIADKILLELKGKVALLSRPPGLAVILIGDDEASYIYVNAKKKACHKIGIEFHDYLCDKKCYPDINEKKILEMIDFLNNDSSIDAIIVQLQIPKKFNTKKIINQISPEKDVDGFHPENMKKFLAGKALLVPPLIGAINLALESTNEELKNKQAIILAKNPIFSESLKVELEKVKGLNVKIIKPEKGFEQETKNADVLISVLGKKHFIKKSMVKDDAILIDVGTNLIGKKKWAGDVDSKVAEVASWLTPVPGGIGPLTVACLLKNTYELAKKNLKA